MRLIHATVGAIEHAVIGSGKALVALVSRLIDATIGIVGRVSERLDRKLAGLARESVARREREGRRRINPITLD